MELRAESGWTYQIVRSAFAVPHENTAITITNRPTFFMPTSSLLHSKVSLYEISEKFVEYCCIILLEVRVVK